MRYRARRRAIHSWFLGISLLPFLVFHAQAQAFHILPDAFEGHSYTAAINIRLTTAILPLHWSVISGHLPPGLTLTRDGLIVGTPTRARQHAFEFEIEVTDSSPKSDRISGDFIILVSPAPQDLETMRREGQPMSFGGGTKHVTAPPVRMSKPISPLSLDAAAVCVGQTANLKVENHEVQSLLAGRSVQELQKKRPLTGAISKAPGTTTATPNLRWLLNINAPASVAFGTTSQQTYGGLLDMEIYEGRLYHSEVLSGGSYNRTWGIGSPSIYTDIFDGYFQQSRSLSEDRGGLYGRTEWFLNTALGMALQTSYGVGYFSPDKKAGPFQLKWLADLRYFNERLYGTTSHLSLAGSRFEGQLIYRKKDSEDPSKTKVLVYFTVLD
ncbi:MAG TPA: Ig domain-containing protein [Nitrospira sp.]|nr:Ig domain-containing protein [Nitrospira sp.]